MAECPRGGAHGWEVEEVIAGEWVRYCWKCGTTEPVDVVEVDL